MKLDLSKVAPREILTKSGNKTYPLNIAYSGEKVLVGNRKDKWNNFYHQKYITVPKEKICLWYSWPTGKNQNQEKNTGVRYNYLLMSKYLLLDKLTMNVLGLLQAEMTKGDKRKSNISFTNSEPNLINLVVTFFKRFALFEDDWSWSIYFNFKLKRQETTEETINREKSAEKYWKKYACISSHKRRNKFIQYTGNKKYSNMRKSTMGSGSLRIDHSNIILFQVILKLLEDIKTKIAPELIRNYLQGIFAGEASIKPTRFGSLDNVNVGAVKRTEQEFYARCLLVLGIPSSFEKNCIKIHNLRNFLKIKRSNLLELHPIRHEKFLRHLSNYKQIPKKLKAEYSSFKKEVKDDLCNVV